MTRKVLTNFGFKVGANSFTNWTSMRVHTSMLSLVDSFGFMDVDFSRGDYSRWQIKRDQVVSVFVEDETLITGWIDSIPKEYSPESFNIKFIGRDKTCDLVDCCYVESNNEFKRQTRANIIRRLLAPFDIELVIDTTAAVSANVKIDTFKAGEGRFIYDDITELCRDSGLLALSYGDGKLTLTKTRQTEKANDPIQFGVNAIYGKHIDDYTDRFSDYYVKGYGTGSDSKRLADFISPIGYFKDEVVSRYRPFTVFADRATDSGKCYERAKWEARIRAGLSQAIVYQVPGWLQSDDSIWKKNTIATVYDPILGLDAQQLLICDVDYVYDEKENPSAYCSLLLVDPDTFSGTAADINIKTGFDA
jgi:prophage tail gpP-like protein